MTKVTDEQKRSAISEALRQLNDIESILRELRKGIINESQLACLSVCTLGDYMDKKWAKESKEYFKELTGFDWDGR